LHIALKFLRIRLFEAEKPKFRAAYFKLWIEIMNARKKFALAMGISSLAALPLMSALVTVQVPAPAVSVNVGVVPDTYVWDGDEYVGVVGSQYYYLGPGNVWLVMDTPRLARFHDWERGHADWHSRAIENVRFRTDAHGHDVPRHDDRDHNHHW
jgi:hypothetical protein